MMIMIKINNRGGAPPYRFGYGYNPVMDDTYQLIARLDHDHSWRLFPEEIADKICILNDRTARIGIASFGLDLIEVVTGPLKRTAHQHTKIRYGGFLK